MGTPTFYHDLSVEAGGASPNRLFSYYAGVSGFNQDFRYLSNDNGVGYGNEFPVTWPGNVTTNLSFWPAVYPNCNANDPNNFYNNPVANPNNQLVWVDPGCFSSLGPEFGNVSMINGREVVANVHFGIPHKYDSGRDDVQLLIFQFRAVPPVLYECERRAAAVEHARERARGRFLGVRSGGAVRVSRAHVARLLHVSVGNHVFAAGDRLADSVSVSGLAANRCYNTDWVGGQDSSAASPITVPNQCAAGDVLGYAERLS